MALLMTKALGVENQAHNDLRGRPQAGATMRDYAALFEVEDRERVFRFLALFARWECALKRTEFVKTGQHGQAEADWDLYADAVVSPLAALSAGAFIAAREALVANPPRRQQLDGKRVRWVANPRRAKETDARYLLRVVRDVRNNLFHGSKYQDGPVDELARDQRLIDHATTILEACVDLEPRVRAVFDEAA